MAFPRLANGLRHKGPRWLVVAVLILLGLLVGDWLDKATLGTGFRYWLFQAEESLSHRVPYADRTAVVLIGDEEYWKSELSGRAPINREFLGKLVLMLDKANPAVIALDFDLRSPLPDGSLIEHPAYQTETNALLEALKTVSQHRTIVLPETIGFDADRRYVRESDIYDGFDFGNGKVRTGYIALPYDIRQVPLNLTTAAGENIDSFAEAMVGAYSKGTLERLPGSNSVPPYGSYIKERDFTQASAADVLAGKPDILSKLAYKIVLVGGHWHSLAYNRGAEIDGYPTPVGTIPGVFIHANYVEALLDGRTYRTWTESVLVGIDILLALAVATVFAMEFSRALVKVGILVLLCAGLVFFSIFSWQVLGLLFDFSIPIILLVLKSIVEQILHWRTEAHKRNPKEGAIA